MSSVLTRPPRRTTTDKVLLSKAKTAELDADWKLVREMELYVYGAHYHRLDGTTNALGYDPVEEERHLDRATDYLSKRGQEIRQQGMRELAEMDPGDMSMAEYASFRRATMEPYARRRGMFDD